MAGRIAYYGNIVTDGLVLNLDAGKKESYPGIGTVWRDISQNNLTGSLINGPIYDSNNYGSIVFDGVNDYVDGIGDLSTFSFIQNTGIFTISSWVRLTDLSTARYFIGNNDGTTTSKGFFLGYIGSNGMLSMQISYGVSGQLALGLGRTNFFLDNNWVLVTCVGNGTSCQLYKNGQLFGSSQSIVTLSTGNSSRTLSIGRVNNYNSSYWQGNVAQTSIYNRALTSQEITQNFNAYKSRYGL